MKKVLLALGIIFTLVTGQAYASSASKIGVVDLQRAVSECKAGIAARTDLQKKTDDINAELKLLMADFEKSKAELDKDGAKLSATARAGKEMQLKKKAREFQNRQREAQEDIKQLEADHLKEVVARLGGILEKIGDEGNFTVVLDKKNGVFYTGKEIDITQLLVKRADQEYGR